MALRTLALLGLASVAMTAVMARPRDDEDYESSEAASEEMDKVYGGGYASLGMFPFMAVIHRLVEPRKFNVCSGSIISERWVLTAGHCVRGRPSVFFLGFGLVDKEGIRYDHVTGGGVSMISSRVYVHPGYALGVNDIGLVHAPRDIPFGATIQPIRLAGGAYASETFDDTPAHIFGWGKEGRDKPASQRLKYGLATVLPKSVCRKTWLVDDDHICTIDTEEQDVCQGDSGGPLVIREDDDELLQIGIVSFGEAACPSYRPAVFTRVSSYASWIHKITGVQID